MLGTLSAGGIRQVQAECSGVMAQRMLPRGTGCLGHHHGQGKLQLFSHLKEGVRGGKTGRGEKGKREISKLEQARMSSICLFHFSPFPFFLITHAVTPFG